MKIGIDLDNTIICYEPSLRKIAEARGIAPKASIKAAIKSGLDNATWTAIQGELYGKWIQYAEPFPGFLDFIEEAKKAKVPCCIISHKTAYAAFGEPYDFREAARAFLKAFNLDTLPVFFLESQTAKLIAIKEQGCTHFIDDLPGILTHPDFPSGVERFLFSPSQSHPDGPFRILNSWDEAHAILKEKSGAIHLPQAEAESSATSEDTVRTHFASLLKAAKNTELVFCERVLKGRNNQGYRIRAATSDSFFAKRYYTSKTDTRKRMQHEVGFLELLAGNNLPVSRVLAKDPLNHAALYSYIEGAPVHTPAPYHWEACLDFLTQIQDFRGKAKHIPSAADAAFSLAEHLAFLQARRDTWRSLALSKKLLPEVASLVLNTFERAYQQIAASCLNHPRFSESIPLAGRILSPSDFGLHNALENQAGRLFFVDFEYAGWDDPAKTVADFFAQPDCPPPPAFKEAFAYQLAACLPEAERAFFYERLPLVEKIIALKWCAILLNPLHPNYQEKARFLAHRQDPKAQLELVKTRLTQLEEAAMIGA